MIPVLSVMPKDHKPLNKDGEPKTRPVVGADTCANGRMSDIMSDFLGPVADAIKESDECKSTEEMLYKTEEATKVIEREGENVVVASEDVEGIFPNLEIMACSKICAAAVKESQVELSGVDFIWGCKYIAMSCSREEIQESELEGVVPKRKYRRGVTPGVTGKEAKSKKKDGEEEEQATRWTFRRTEFTEEEKRNILAKVVEIAVRTTFRLHMYQFEGKIRLQKAGGPIGLRLTGVVARLVMMYWEKKFKQILMANNITAYMFAWYVDDVNLLLQALGLGWRWTGEKLEWKVEWEKEDEEKNENDDVRTMREIKKISNSILPFIKFEEIVASQCKAGKVPMLDFQVWKEEKEVEKDGERKVKTEIKFEFYEKDVSSKTVVMEKSTIPIKTKISTLSQEVLRRMRNTSRNVKKERREEILTEFMKKLKRSGYNAKTRREILIAGMKGYMRLVKEEEEGRRRVNRPRWEGATSRRYKKLGGKGNWYKHKKSKSMEKGKESGASKGKIKRSKGEEEEKKIEAVMFVPSTPGGVLAKMLQQTDDRLAKETGQKKIKMVERGGATLKSILSRLNPWGKEGCTRSDCFPCKGEKGKGGNCQAESCVYRINCEECKGRGVASLYIGETSRTPYLRGKEHLAKLQGEAKDSALWDHCVEEHGGEKVNFSMKVGNKHKTPFTRQVEEAVAIETCIADILLNSKSEFYCSRIPRVKIEVGNKIVGDTRVSEWRVRRKAVDGATLQPGGGDIGAGGTPLESDGGRNLVCRPEPEVGESRRGDKRKRENQEEKSKVNEKKRRVNHVESKIEVESKVQELKKADSQKDKVENTEIKVWWDSKNSTPGSKTMENVLFSKNSTSKELKRKAESKEKLRKIKQSKNTNISKRGKSKMEMAACKSLKITSFFKPFHNQHADLLGAGAGVDQNNFSQIKCKKEVPGMGDTRESESTVGGEGNKSLGSKGGGGGGNLDIQSSSQGQINGSRKLRHINTDDRNSHVTVINVPLCTEEVYDNKRN